MHSPNSLIRSAALLFLVILVTACQPAPTPTPIPTPMPQPTVTPALAPTSPTEVSAWRPGQFEIVLMDVKHGDAQLIISPTGESLLIDVGEEPFAPAIAEKITTILGKPVVDYFLASHYHVDHIGGFVSLVRDHGLVIRKAVLDRGSGRSAYDSATYRKYFDYVTNPSNSPQRVRLSPGDKIDLGPAVKVDVLAVGDSDKQTNCGIPMLGKNDNDYSIVLWVTFGAFDYWTGGDLSGEDSMQTTDAESACAHLVPRPADLFKADHHSIDWNNNANLLKAVQPQVVLISLDDLGNTAALLRLNKYGRLFATNRIIALAEDRKTPVLVDDSDDLIIISQDGSEFMVEGTIFKSR